MPTAYGEDLAYMHRVGFGAFAEEQAPRLVALLRKANARTVIELGCGSGIATRHPPGATYRRTEETHTQTLYSPAAMLTLLRGAHFKPTLTGAPAPGHYGVTER